jgi:ABC-type protease/lipase transport system fused ATPase/permease subunit
MKIDKKAMLESVTDTSVGFCINFPLAWLVLYIMLFFTKDPLLISVVQASTLTVTAIVRRYVTRIYFKGLTYKDERERLHQQSAQSTPKRNIQVENK